MPKPPKDRLLKSLAHQDSALDERRKRLQKRIGVSSDIFEVGDFEYTVKIPDPIKQLAGTWTSNNLPANDLTRILAAARKAFDDRDKAVRSLQEPNIPTGNKPPLSLIGTPKGFEAVETVLLQIQYGVIG